jgi:DNA-binding response OmpR family regulator
MAYVLIVDDDEDFASALRTMLEASGHEADLRLDPAGGLKSIETRRPDLAILDVMFPESATAGFDLARQIRQRFGALPVIMLTAVNQRFPLGFSSGDIDESWLPVMAFLEKPIDFKMLKRKADELLSRSGAGTSS